MAEIGSRRGGEHGGEFVPLDAKLRRGDDDRAVALEAINAHRPDGGEPAVQTTDYAREL